MAMGFSIRISGGIWTEACGFALAESPQTVKSCAKSPCFLTLMTRVVPGININVPISLRKLWLSHQKQTGCKNWWINNSYCILKCMLSLFWLFFRLHFGNTRKTDGLIPSSVHAASTNSSNWAIRVSEPGFSQALCNAFSCSQTDTLSPEKHVLHEHEYWNFAGCVSSVRRLDFSSVCAYHSLSNSCPKRGRLVCSCR